MTGDALKDWLAAYPSGVAKLLRVRPILASDPEIWRALGPDEAWEALRRLRGKNQRVEVIAAMVRSGLEIDSVQVAQAWAGTGLAVAERLVDEGVTDERLGPWIDTLSVAQKHEFAKRANQSPQVLAAVTASVDPAQLAEWDLSLLLQVAATTVDPVVQAKLFLAALHQTGKPTWAGLGVAAYERVYQIAVAKPAKPLGEARDLLADVARDELPDWDVGARVAKAMNRALKQDRWPAVAALACRNKPAFLALIRSDEKAGLARRILEAAFDAPTDMEDWQRSALFDITRKKADRDALATLFGRVESIVASAWHAMRPW